MIQLLKRNKTARLKRYLQEGATLLDVRFVSEYNSGHIPESINIPLPSLNQKMDQLDKNKPIVVYCALGGRSTVATAKLKSRGFKVIDGRSMKSIKKLI